VHRRRVCDAGGSPRPRDDRESLSVDCGCWTADRPQAGRDAPTFGSGARVGSCAWAWADARDNMTALGNHEHRTKGGIRPVQGDDVAPETAKEPSGRGLRYPLYRSDVLLATPPIESISEHPPIGSHSGNPQPIEEVNCESPALPLSYSAAERRVSSPIPSAKRTQRARAPAPGTVDCLTSGRREPDRSRCGTRHRGVP
jgi:hypothetical protein